MQRFLFLILLFVYSPLAAPVFLDDQFELPKGFRIYRAAEKELTGGSYALRFDGQGRLLVGDGTALRRLVDKDGDGVFDGYEVIATGLGWRGPQGILVYGDRLYCVGGDGIQMYEGYTNGPLKHLGRIGEKFNTGGDHDGHTLLRGHDGYIYFMAGNGAGITNRTHITEETSPCLIEREASVFRISPDGKKWECIANGGRNPPNLGQNYLGDFFSFDSDMEWHVGLPWYRPCRLNHWVIGGDQGWQEVGAYPPYYIDNLPGILDVGRGSPTWGVFYEHNQFPKKYENAYLCCDYRWKAESNDEYHTTGRLVAFFLERSGSRWKAKMETLCRPKAGAKDANGRSIPFALVDIDVAPDGSIYLTEHNQGIWRIVYDPKKNQHHGPPNFYGVRPLWSDGDFSKGRLIPQPSSEWSRVRIEEDFSRLSKYREFLGQLATDPKIPLDRRLWAIRALASTGRIGDLATALYRDKNVELRVQAAWLAGLHGGDSLPVLGHLLHDESSFVRRRALESLLRNADPESLKRISDEERFVDTVPSVVSDLIFGCGSDDRTIAYLSMIALSHISPGLWQKRISQLHVTDVPLYWLDGIAIHGLVAGYLRGDHGNVEARRVLNRAAWSYSYTPEKGQLDFLRAVELFHSNLDTNSRSNIANTIASSFTTPSKQVDWERASALGVLQVPETFQRVFKLFQKSSDPFRQFHMFVQVAKFSAGWDSRQEKETLEWVLKTQTGWFADFNDKGVEFPLFLQTALEEFASNHQEAVLAARDRINVESLLGSALLGVIARREPETLFVMYRRETVEGKKAKYLQAMARLPNEKTAEFLRGELKTLASPALRKAALGSLKAMPKSAANEPFLREATASSKPERKDEEIHAAILAASLEAGDAARGRKIYERLLCNSCHGGGQTPGQEGRIFGPDLAGVTARLTRGELADAIVYPSKQVADRFKAMAATLQDGRELTGFVTERTADHVTFIDAQTIHRLAPAEIVSMAPQEKSLMPEGLTRTLTDQEIAHLLKFLSVIGTR